MRITKVLQHIIISTALIVSACKVGPNYKRPLVKVPEKFLEDSGDDSTSVANLKWSEFFEDKELIALVDSGLLYNNDLKIAIKRIDIAQEQVKQARLQLLPQVNLQVSGLYNRFSENSMNGLSAKQFGIDHIENYNASAGLSWELDVWGKIRRYKEATLAEYLQTYEATRAVQTRLIADIAQGYFNLQMLDKQLLIARRNLSLNDSTLALTRLLKNAGDVTELAVQQAETQRQSTALLIPQLEQSIALQENALQLLTGRLPGKVSRSAGNALVKLPLELKPGLPASVVSRRPDIRASEMTLKAANARVGVAKANLYPSLTVSGSAGVESYKSSNWFNVPSSWFGLASGAVLQPVFRSRSLRAQYETAKHQRDQAELQFKQSVLTAMTEVSNALVETDKLKQQQDIASEQVDTLRKSIRNATLLFKSDMANYLEVITAQRNALQAELNQVSIERQQKAALVELYRSLGGGWQ